MERNNNKQLYTDIHSVHTHTHTHTHTYAHARTQHIHTHATHTHTCATHIHTRTQHTHTAMFQQRDMQRNGTATFRYDDFIQVAMSF